ncbi:hypothetical protein Taro_009203 [Colocasia esculenta]|uniref:DUF642 domain-containing protein n=1 Tax=Colocasia esculenta TaxID=4460 RepID=A0A843TZP2_COLES|nr:hypothetical protein [Colocasia esculenta]
MSSISDSRLRSCSNSLRISSISESRLRASVRNSSTSILRLTEGGCLDKRKWMPVGASPPFGCHFPVKENGDFEKEPDRAHMKGAQVLERNAIPGWSIDGFVEFIESGWRSGWRSDWRSSTSAARRQRGAGLDAREREREREREDLQIRMRRRSRVSRRRRRSPDEDAAGAGRSPEEDAAGAGRSPEEEIVAGALGRREIAKEEVFTGAS